MSEIFYVRYHPSHMLAELLELTPLAELAHRRLCDFIWSRNRTPRNDDPALAGLTRLSPSTWRTVKRELLAHGWKVKRGRFSHFGALSVLRAAKDLHNACSLSAKRAAEARWQHADRMRTASAPQSAPHANSTSNRTSKTKSGKTVERSALNAMAKKLSPTEENQVGRAVPSAPSFPDTLSPTEENRFLADVAAVINNWKPAGASQELSNWGGWWRNRYRENSDKARRVLAELSAMVRERKIQRNPGAAATDLWKRFP